MQAWEAQLQQQAMMNMRLAGGRGKALWMLHNIARSLCVPRPLHESRAAPMQQLTKPDIQ